MDENGKFSADQIADDLSKMVENGSLRTGDTVPSERTIAERYHVSRPTARQAVHLLARRGFAELSERRRPRITMPAGNPSSLLKESEIAAILGQPDGHVWLEQMRQVIELGAVRAIARAGSLSHIGKLLAELRKGYAATTPEEFVAADVAFHRCLISCIENPVILSLYDSFITTLFEKRIHLATSQERWARVLAQHESIIDAIRGHDYIKASESLEDHLMDAYTESMLLRR